MKLAEKILLSFSRKKPAEDSQVNEQELMRKALSILTGEFPGFVTKIAGKEILDYGCGFGFQVLAMARFRAKCAVGIDTNPRYISYAKSLAERHLSERKRIEFSSNFDGSLRGRFDVVISQNSFEHFDYPSDILRTMKTALKKGGEIYLTFGPPWYSPYGSHMQHFTDLPWVNLLFSEETVMNVRSLYRDDGAKRYEEVESGLNKMSIAKFENIVEKSGMEVKDVKYSCVRRINFLSRIPVVRELAINHVSCVLRA